MTEDLQLRTRVFELYDRQNKSLPELAQAMKIPVSQVNQVYRGSGSVNQKFIIGAIPAFPNHEFDDLFYFDKPPSYLKSQVTR